MSNEKGNLIFERYDHNGNKKISIEDREYHIFNVASFGNEKQLKRYLKKMGLNVVRAEDGLFYTNKPIYRECYIWNKKQLPKNQKAKKMWSLSNGSIVPNYVVQDKEEGSVLIYSLNPNTKLYKKKALSTEKHIKFQKKYGVY